MNHNLKTFLQSVLNNMPADWINLTTHRLDIYDEPQAKVQFLNRFNALYERGDATADALRQLPTAFDYIRLGHPLSCVLEWAVAKLNGSQPDSVISFASVTMPLLAILRKNLLDQRTTRVVYSDDLPATLEPELLHRIYGYAFTTVRTADVSSLPAFSGSTVLYSRGELSDEIGTSAFVDFHLRELPGLGSLLVLREDVSKDYVPAVQHVRRRESIAMTPADCYTALQQLTGAEQLPGLAGKANVNKATVAGLLREITGTTSDVLLASSGLSMQYAITMGLLQDAADHHPGKQVRIIIPPNCYGGTNDQARRVAATLDHVAVLDLPVDGGENMVDGLEKVLAEVAATDAVPYVIAEIPTNPRVEVPDLIRLRDTLGKERFTNAGAVAVPPVFILDQTFCPNVHFLGEGEILATVRAIAYASGSKFPSGGLCTAGYCVSNKKAEVLMPVIGTHLALCDNGATATQLSILAEQIPSMNQRIAAAYRNTRSFVEFIRKTLPEAKINFVSEDLAAQGFTPSVFSLDLPAHGDTPAAREANKRTLNHRLINAMIERIPSDSKHCVSYGQLKGCYWTIPATSTQGTTKEGDKDYIVRVALSPDMDVERHQQVFAEFVADVYAGVA